MSPGLAISSNMLQTIGQPHLSGSLINGQAAMRSRFLILALLPLSIKAHAV
jgi:hypothetical protein